MPSARARVGLILLCVAGLVLVLARTETRSSSATAGSTGPEPPPSVDVQVAVEQAFDRSGGGGRSPVSMATTPTPEVGASEEASAEEPHRVSAIRGSIRFEDGRPAANVVIHAQAEEASGPATANSDVDGAYELEVGPESESFELEIRHGDLLYGKTGVAPGSRGVDFVLARTAVVHYRVFDALTHGAYREFDICWRRTGEREWLPLALTEPRLFETEWWFRAELAEGLVDLLVMRRAGNLLPRHLEGVSIQEELDPWLEIGLEPGLELELQFDPDAGALPPGHQLALFEVTGAPMVPCLSEGQSPRRGYWDVELVPRGMHILRPTSAGRVRVGGLAPGVVVLRGCPEDLAFTPTQVLVRGPFDGPVLVTWRLADPPGGR